jgi:hypothetical protein
MSTRQINFPLLTQTLIGTVLDTWAKTNGNFLHLISFPQGLSSRLVSRYYARHYEEMLDLHFICGL